MPPFRRRPREPLSIRGLGPVTGEAPPDKIPPPTTTAEDGPVVDELLRESPMTAERRLAWLEGVAFGSDIGAFRRMLDTDPLAAALFRNGRQTERLRSEVSIGALGGRVDRLESALRAIADSGPVTVGSELWRGILASRSRKKGCSRTDARRIAVIALFPNERFDR